MRSPERSIDAANSPPIRSFHTSLPDTASQHVAMPLSLTVKSKSPTRTGDGNRGTPRTVFQAMWVSVTSPRPAGLLVERDDILHVHAVHRQDEQVAEQDRRRAWPPIVPAGKVVALPDYLAARRVEARSSIAAEVHKHPARLDHRRRRGVTVQR